MASARAREHVVLAAVAAELRGEAARQRLSLHELSRQSGIPYPTVQKSMAGRRMIDVVELARLCVALGISPGEMFQRAEAALDDDPPARDRLDA